MNKAVLTQQEFAKPEQFPAGFFTLISLSHSAATLEGTALERATQNEHDCARL
jgi:hypothetical protein